MCQHRFPDGLNASGGIDNRKTLGILRGKANDLERYIYLVGLQDLLFTRWLENHGDHRALPVIAPAGPSITYNREADGDDRLTVPIGLGVTKTVRFGKTPVKLRAEAHYSVVRPDSYGEVWNFRLQITPVIPSPFIK